MKASKENIFINIGFVLIPALLMYIGITGILDLRRYQKENEWLSKNYKIIETNALLLSNIKDAETGQRGYIITSDSTFLDPYFGTKERNAELVLKLKELTRDDQTLQQNIDSIATLSNLRLVILDYAMQLKVSQGTAASAAQLSKGLGKNVMDKMRWYCNKVDQYERALLDNQTQRATHSSTKAKSTFFISVMFTGLSTIIIFLLLKMEIQKRKRAEKELFISREWYASTLTNLGEGVITTDTQHKITFMNKAAEDLTQWKYTEALGRPVELIFNLINEYTRKPIESPVIKAFEEKKHIAHPEHVLLIRKGGYEINIDISTVPLLDNMGNTIGSVLIFKNITEQIAARRKLQNINVNVDNIVRLRTQRLDEEENRFGTI